MRSLTGNFKGGFTGGDSGRSPRAGLRAEFTGGVYGRSLRAEFTGGVYGQSHPARGMQGVCTRSASRVSFHIARSQAGRFHGVKWLKTAKIFFQITYGRTCSADTCVLTLFGG